MSEQTLVHHQPVSEPEDRAHDLGDHEYGCWCKPLWETAVFERIGRPSLRTWSQHWQRMVPSLRNLRQLWCVHVPVLWTDDGSPIFFCERCYCELQEVWVG